MLELLHCWPWNESLSCDWRLKIKINSFGKLLNDYQSNNWLAWKTWNQFSGWRRLFYLLFSTKIRQVLRNSYRKFSLHFHYCRMSSPIRHRFLGWFSTKSILSASLSSSGSLQSPSFSPSPSPSSSCFRFAVASSAACLLRHFVRRFWNQTWRRREESEKLLKINHKNLVAHSL